MIHYLKQTGAVVWFVLRELLVPALLLVGFSMYLGFALFGGILRALLRRSE